MLTPQSSRVFTVEEYLRQEETALEKHEFHAGKIIEASRGSYEQSVIVINLCAALLVALRGTPCRCFESSLRVGILKPAALLYPDVQVMCGQPQFDPRDPKRGTLFNPTVVIEAVSEESEAYDRGRKFELYRNVESLREYVLVSQREPLIESYLRRDQDEWAFDVAKGLESTARLRSLNIRIPLRNIYQDVSFTCD